MSADAGVQHLSATLGSVSFPAISFPAHQGGWDEILLVAGPLVVIGGLLWLANKRVSARLSEQETLPSDEADQSP